MNGRAEVSVERGALVIKIHDRKGIHTNTETIPLTAGQRADLAERLLAENARAQNMRITPEGIKLLKALEGSVTRSGRHVVYDDGTGAPITDIPIGGATIGHGHLLKDGEAFPNGLSEDEATALLRSDLAWAEKMVDDTITRPMTAQQFDAWVIHGFNLGQYNFTVRASSVKAFNAGRAGEVPARMQLWDKALLANGTTVKSPGLVRRRAATSALFVNGYEAAWKQWRS